MGWANNTYVAKANDKIKICVNLPALTKDVPSETCTEKKYDIKYCNIGKKKTKLPRLANNDYV